jgi:hypothetical protein
MGKKLLPLLLVLGCQSPPNPTEDDPDRWGWATASFDSPTPWSHDPYPDLAVRLKAQGPFSLGRPTLVTLEVKNTGSRRLYFDSQELFFVPYEMAGPDRRKIPCVARSAYRGQTGPHDRVLEPGASLDLDRIDLTKAFAILEPGLFSVRFDGLRKVGDYPGAPQEGAPSGAVETGVPASDPLRLEVLDGALSLRDRVLQRLLPTVPKDWVLYEDASGTASTTLAYFRRDLDRSGRSATLRIGCGSTPDPEARVLGSGPLGNVRFGKVRVGRMNPRDAEDARWERELEAAFVPKFEESLKRDLSLKP